MVSDKAKKPKVSEKGEEDSDHIDGELILSMEKLQEIQDELEKERLQFLCVHGSFSMPCLSPTFFYCVILDILCLGGWVQEPREKDDSWPQAEDDSPIQAYEKMIKSSLKNRGKTTHLGLVLQDCSGGEKERWG
ncbi:hypothetical protein NE237_006038 [Protea cynaroides]|uniref:Uncharacterized protein n=1 Tax=Protea cynaroides TaxID=273540 RepID=A0A9Q0KMB6_9MAGN|nr:hypothetical protein NE237_006038 [Protea cynaroides]